uniref:Uncharacterized protein n=1 Tax=Meloidogyne enterolobii TaxID=390850 RepID=A0A6V7Y5W3_MELEN|nr:unnamed protein product [Meloidogyne enterolobii]
MEIKLNKRNCPKPRGFGQLFTIHVIVDPRNTFKDILTFSEQFKIAFKTGLQNVSCVILNNLKISAVRQVFPHATITGKS